LLELLLRVFIISKQQKINQLTFVIIEPLESFANEDILVATLYSGANVKISAVALALINETSK